MALLFADGFDWYATGQDCLLRWPTTTNSSNASLVNGSSTRHGYGQAIACVAQTGGLYLDRDIGADINPAILGFAGKFNVLGSGWRVRFNEPAILHVEVRTDASGAISVYRNATLLGTSAAGKVAAGVWHYIEIKAYVADGTAGYVTVYVDGVSAYSLTGVDTRNGGTGVIRYITIFIPGSAESMYIDDVYLCDTSGSVNNDFLGDRRILTIHPDSAGDSTQFTPSSGSNYQCVDEAQQNGDTDYVESSTAGHVDLYNMGSLTLSPVSINAVQTISIMRKDDAGARTARAKLKSGGTTVNGSTITLSTSYAASELIRETDPATSSAWTESGVNAVQAGVEVVS